MTIAVDLGRKATKPTNQQAAHNDQLDMMRECSGSVVECLTRDRGCRLSLTGATALCPSARHINPSL